MTAERAMRELRAKLDAAALECLRSGRSWGEGPVTFSGLADPFEPRPIWDYPTYSAEVKAGPVPHDWQPPSGWRVIRWADWDAAGRPGF